MGARALKHQTRIMVAPQQLNTPKAEEIIKGYQQIAQMGEKRHHSAGQFLQVFPILASEKSIAPALPITAGGFGGSAHAQKHRTGQGWSGNDLHTRSEQQLHGVGSQIAAAAAAGQI